MTDPNAAFVVIGNEILSGRTREGNLQTLAQKLSPHGIEVREARVVPDIEENIIATIRDLGDKYKYVFTSGGIGPTHDDITAGAIANAFNTTLHENPEARAMLLVHYGEDQLTEARLKMAQIPKGARLIENPVSKAPGFWIDNVLVMAGVPNIFAAMVDSVLPFLSGGKPMVSGTLIVQVGESVIADVMASVESEFQDLTIGSYPYFRMGEFGTSLVVRSRDKVAVKSAMATLLQRLNALGHTVEDQGIQLPGNLG